jgi:hypothetical protein
MQRDFQAAKVEALARGNLSAEASKVIAAGHRALAKEAHPDAGGTHEEMLAVNLAVEALEKGKIIHHGMWWKQEFNDIAAQMATHFTIKDISALCAMAIDLRKAKQAQAAEQQQANGAAK